MKKRIAIALGLMVAALMAFGTNEFAALLAERHGAGPFFLDYIGGFMAMGVGVIALTLILIGVCFVVALLIEALSSLFESRNRFRK